MKKRPRRVSECLASGSTMESLLSQARKQQQLLELVRSLLPEPLPQHCSGVVISAGNLLIYTDSSAWAGRIRFISSDLNQKLNSKGLKVNRIAVRVQLKNATPRHIKSHSNRQLSKDNASLILETAETIEDPDLQAAMKRLARHHN